MVTHETTCTLAEYETTKKLSKGTMARMRRRKGFPTPVGTRPNPPGRAGRPAPEYRTEDLDRFLAVQEGVVTVAEYAEARGLDPDQITTLPAPVGERGGEPVYRETGLDAARGLVTVAEYAELHRLAETTVALTWPTRYPELFPANEGKRGRSHLYPEQALDRVRRRAHNLPEQEGSPRDLLDWGEVCAYLAPVTTRQQMDHRRWTGRWPAGVVVDGVERWERRVVDQEQERLGRGEG